MSQGVEAKFSAGGGEPDLRGPNRPFYLMYPMIQPLCYSGEATSALLAYIFRCSTMHSPSAELEGRRQGPLAESLRSFALKHGLHLPCQSRIVGDCSRTLMEHVARDLDKRLGAKGKGSSRQSRSDCLSGQCRLAGKSGVKVTTPEMPMQLSRATQVAAVPSPSSTSDSQSARACVNTRAPSGECWEGPLVSSGMKPKETQDAWNRPQVEVGPTPTGRRTSRMHSVFVERLTLVMQHALRSCGPVEQTVILLDAALLPLLFTLVARRHVVSMAHEYWASKAMYAAASGLQYVLWRRPECTWLHHGLVMTMLCAIAASVSASLTRSTLLTVLCPPCVTVLALMMRRKACG